MEKDSLKLSKTLRKASDFASLLSSEILSLLLTQNLAFLTWKQNNANQILVSFRPANGKPVFSILATSIYTAIFALHT